MIHRVDSPDIGLSEVKESVDLNDKKMYITLYEQDVGAVHKGIDLGMGYLDRKNHLLVSKATGPYAKPQISDFGCGVGGGQKCQVS